MTPEQTVSRRLDAFTRFLDRMPELAGQEAVSFFKERFEEQGWRDGSFSPWARKKIDNNYPTLRSRNTNGLVDTIHHQVTGNRQVIIHAGGPGKPYAQIHNTGGITHPRVTPKLRKWAWAMYYKTHDPKYKAIALTKRATLSVVIPKRQYMGQNKDLEKIILQSIQNNLKRILK